MLLGFVLSSIYNTYTGFKNASNGKYLASIASKYRENVINTSASFAVWGFLFSAYDCSLVWYRKKVSDLLRMHVNGKLILI